MEDVGHPGKSGARGGEGDERRGLSRRSDRAQAETPGSGGSAEQAECGQTALELCAASLFHRLSLISLSPPPFLFPFLTLPSAASPLPNVSHSFPPTVPHQYQSSLRRPTRSFPTARRRSHSLPSLTHHCLTKLTPLSQQSACSFSLRSSSSPPRPACPSLASATASPIRVLAGPSSRRPSSPLLPLRLPMSSSSPLALDGWMPTRRRSATLATLPSATATSFTALALPGGGPRASARLRRLRSSSASSLRPQPRPRPSRRRFPLLLPRPRPRPRRLPLPLRSRRHRRRRRSLLPLRPQLLLPPLCLPRRQTLRRLDPAEADPSLPVSVVLLSLSFNWLADLFLITPFPLHSAYIQPGPPRLKLALSPRPRRPRLRTLTSSRSPRRSTTMTTPSSRPRRRATSPFSELQNFPFLSLHGAR